MKLPIDYSLSIPPIQYVAEFHRAFGQPVEDKPVIPAEDRCRLRIELIQEELLEFRKAAEEEDLIECADALTDLQYVIFGTYLEFGIADQWLNYAPEKIALTLPHIPRPGEIARSYESMKYYFNWLEPLIKDKNIVVVIDLLKNLQQSLSRTFHIFGLGAHWHLLLQEVHRSNMSKFAKDIHYAKHSLEFYHQKGIECYPSKTDYGFAIINSNTGKVLKSNSFILPYIKAVLACNPDKSDEVRNILNKWESPEAIEPQTNTSAIDGCAFSSDYRPETEVKRSPVNDACSVDSGASPAEPAKSTFTPYRPQFVITGTSVRLKEFIIDCYRNNLAVDIECDLEKITNDSFLCASYVMHGNDEVSLIAVNDQQNDNSNFLADWISEDKKETNINRPLRYQQALEEFVMINLSNAEDEHTQDICNNFHKAIKSERHLDDVFTKESVIERNLYKPVVSGSFEYLKRFYDYGKEGGLRFSSMTKKVLLHHTAFPDPEAEFYFAPHFLMYPEEAELNTTLLIMRKGDEARDRFINADDVVHLNAYFYENAINKCLNMQHKLQGNTGELLVKATVQASNHTVDAMNYAMHSMMDQSKVKPKYKPNFAPNTSDFLTDIALKKELTSGLRNISTEDKLPIFEKEIQQEVLTTDNYIVRYYFNDLTSDCRALRQLLQDKQRIVDLNHQHIKRITTHVKTRILLNALSKKQSITADTYVEVYNFLYNQD